MQKTESSFTFSLTQENTESSEVNNDTPEQEENVEEERRLAYVGITRAQRELTFSIARERRQYGEVINPEPSRFLYELPQDDLAWEHKKPKVSAQERQQKSQVGIANLRNMMNKS